MDKYKRTMHYVFFSGNAIPFVFDNYKPTGLKFSPTLVALSESEYELSVLIPWQKQDF